MKILGISALDTDSTASLIIDGKLVYSAGEERFSRTKQHAGFPVRAVEYVLSEAGLTPEDIDSVAYCFYPWYHEFFLISAGFFKNMLYNLFAKGEGSKFYHFAYYARWCKDSCISHRKYHKELVENLQKLGLDKKLERVEHHAAHSAAAFYTSGFNDALIVTIDAYGSGLAGSVSVGSSSGIKRVFNIDFPSSLGLFYAQVTEALGFKPTRHEGKIVGLAAFGDPARLYDKIASRFDESGMGYKYVSSMDMKYARNLAKEFSREDMSAAYQVVLERVVTKMLKKFLVKYKQENIVLAGGVIANVKLNQRIFEIDDVKNIFVHPNMGDGGTGTGAALWLAAANDPSMKPYVQENAYCGPEFTDDEIKQELDKEELSYRLTDNIEEEVAKLLHEGNVVARFNGRMEYGPRALGNRTIMYHAKEPEVNNWLNEQLKRSEFMPFAPATLYEHRNECYIGMEGAEHTSKFMTITFDCTEFMKKNSPAAIHVDGTARPQLVDEKINPSFYKIINEYYKLSGIPSIINTSFNMHEEPIVCTPYDAIRAFKLGNLGYLAIGNYLVKN